MQLTPADDRSILGLLRTGNAAQNTRNGQRTRSGSWPATIVVVQPADPGTPKDPYYYGSFPDLSLDGEDDEQDDQCCNKDERRCSLAMAVCIVALGAFRYFFN